MDIHYLLLGFLFGYVIGKVTGYIISYAVIAVPQMRKKNSSSVQPADNHAKGDTEPGKSEDRTEASVKEKKWIKPNQKVPIVSRISLHRLQTQSPPSYRDLF